MADRTSPDREDTLVEAEGVNAGASEFEDEVADPDDEPGVAAATGDRPGMAAVQNGSGGRLPGLPSDGGAARPGPDGASADLFRSGGTRRRD
jgi:hypothetical protein